MSKPRNPSYFVLGALGLCLSAGACKDDPPTPKLFQEDGVWSVINYDIGGGGELREVDNTNRRDAFMLSFDSAEKVVTSAACLETDNDDVSNSPCLLNPDTTYWDCRCFSYDFANEEMLWREFNAGDIPPTVALSEANDAGDAGGTDTDGAGGGGDTDTYIVVAEIMDVASTYNFRPLPDGLFGSDGVTSRFVLQKRAGSVFERAYEDPNGRATCTPCVP